MSWFSWEWGGQPLGFWLAAFALWLFLARRRLRRIKERRKNSFKDLNPTRSAITCLGARPRGRVDTNLALTENICGRACCALSVAVSMTNAAVRDWQAESALSEPEWLDEVHLPARKSCLRWGASLCPPLVPRR